MSELFNQNLHVDRLADIASMPASKIILPLQAWSPQSLQQCKADLLSGGERIFSRLQSIHFGHLDIHQDQVIFRAL